MDQRRTVEQLEDEGARLRGELDRYRMAAEETLLQLDWCIGHFTDVGQHGIAASLRANSTSIGRRLRGR